MSDLIQYRTLFSVNILQEYYLPEEEAFYPNQEIREGILNEQERVYDVNNDLVIAPTVETVKRLKDYRLKFKRNNYGFLVGCQVERLPGGGFVPFVNLAGLTSLRFAIYQKNPFFLNYTNLRLDKSIENRDSFIYYLSNRANNVNGGNYLSRAISSFDPALNYEASELIIGTFNAQDYLLEAIEDNSTAPTIGLDTNGNVTADSPWRIIYANQLPFPQFISTDDRLPLRPKFFRLNVESAALERLIIIIRDTNGNDIKSTTCISQEAGVPLRNCPLDLTDLLSGVYEIEVQDIAGTVITSLGLDFYLDSNLTYNKPLGLIECFHEPGPGLGSYRWLDEGNNNQLLSPEYLIRWKSRSTFWRYYYHVDHAPALTALEADNVERFEIMPGNFVANILVSNQPLNLTQVGRRVEINEGGDITLLPNPGINAIFPENGRIYSEINMGGGIGPP